MNSKFFKHFTTLVLLVVLNFLAFACKGGAGKAGAGTGTGEEISNTACDDTYCYVRGQVAYSEREILQAIFGMSPTQKSVIASGATQDFDYLLDNTQVFTTGAQYSHTNVNDSEGWFDLELKTSRVNSAAAIKFIFSERPCNQEGNNVNFGGVAACQHTDAGGTYIYMLSKVVSKQSILSGDVGTFYLKKVYISYTAAQAAQIDNAIEAEEVTTEENDGEGGTVQVTTVGLNYTCNTLYSSPVDRAICMSRIAKCGEMSADEKPDNCNPNHQ